MVTDTKRRAILKSVRVVASEDQRIKMEFLNKLSSRHHVRLDDVVKLVKAQGYIPYGPVPKSPLPTRKVPSQLSDVVKLSIMEGKIFKQLSPMEKGEKPEDVFVVTTLDKLKREREAIRKWIKELGGTLP